MWRSENCRLKQAHWDAARLEVQEYQRWTIDVQWIAAEDSHDGIPIGENNNKLTLTLFVL